MGDDLFPALSSPREHAALVDRAVRWLRGTRGCTLVYGEISTAAALVPDAIGWRGARGCELVEVKVSRSDFRRDREKAGHLSGHTPGVHRWYLTPAGLLRPAEIPEGWGLAEAHARVVRVVVEAPRVAPTLAGVQTEAAILASVARRLHLGVPVVVAERARARFWRRMAEAESSDG